MARKYWRHISKGYGADGGSERLGGDVLIMWVVTMSLVGLLAVIFSCADGVSKEKDSDPHTDTYGTACAAGCGAACGG